MHTQRELALCGKIDAESGVYLVEAMKWAINFVNTNKEVQAGLRRLKFGYRIYDTCNSVELLRTDIIRVQAKNIFGVIGPPTSAEAILAAGAFTKFGIPVVTYSASTMDISRRFRISVGNFYRTVPANDVQARALIDILKHYTWQYISIVCSYGTYGQQGIDQLVKMLEKDGICVSSKTFLPRYAYDVDFKAVIRNLEKDPKARTVLLFTTTKDTHRLLTAAQSKTKFQWLSSSSWDANMQTVRGVNDTAKGAILLNYANINNEAFMGHFKSLKLNKDRYPWFEEFWEQEFNCTMRKRVDSRRRICKGNESLQNSRFYPKYAASNAVIDAVFAYAGATICAINTICKYDEKVVNKKKTCDGNKIFYRLRNTMHLYFKYYHLKNNNCSKFFDRSGNEYRDVEIISFDGKTYKTVGTWKLNSTTQKGTLNITDTAIIWYNGRTNIPVSICSKPCKAGEKKVVNKAKVCCFRCETCKKYEILENNKCVACDKFRLPIRDRTKCKKIVKLHAIKHPLSVLVLIESTVGLILNTIALIMLVKCKHSKILAASSRELSFFMLAGLYLCFFSSSIFLLSPTKAICGLRRLIFGISLTACYTPVMLKTARAYRIVKATHSMFSLPKFITTRLQILINLALLGIQFLLFLMWVVSEPPVVTQAIIQQSNIVADLCVSNFLAIAVNLAPCFCMLALSTFFAFKSRRFPKNFKEALHIGVTMYISCALWVMLFPLLSWANESREPFGETFVMANFSNLIGLVLLFGLFGPKAYQLMRQGKDGIKESVQENNVEFLSMKPIGDGWRCLEETETPGVENDMKRGKPALENEKEIEKLELQGDEQIEKPEL